MRDFIGLECVKHVFTNIIQDILTILCYSDVVVSQTLTCDKSENSEDISHLIWLILQKCPNLSILTLDGRQSREWKAEHAESHLAGRGCVNQDMNEKTFLCFFVDLKARTRQYSEDKKLIDLLKGQNLLCGKKSTNQC